ncbi:hypothetical protein CEP54_009794 [Fusarium duplospermum]|uniref:Uncharacterized protein n=1 Tax=Fusarium duplospermum TaxID=1325734 RepID=A0A428PNN7_9HYPO|nr:hypothetical protein CEP54_009794 [Fusarium duplospermum]
MAASSTPTLPDPVSVDVVPMGCIVGALQRPAPGGDAAKASIAVMVMHAEQDYMSFSACTELPRRGYTVFCVNDAASKTGYMSDLNFEDMMTNAAYAVRYLRNMTEVNKVILFGHSGGGAMLSQYQNTAENGVSACAGPEKIYPCSEAMAGLPPADGVLLNDANFGIGVMTVVSMNPAIEDESSGLRINQDLNLYNVANGFNSSGPFRYTKGFAQRFAQGVHTRNSRIIKFAKERLAAINNGSGLFDDDEPCICLTQFISATITNSSLRIWTICARQASPGSSCMRTEALPFRLFPRFGWLRRLAPSPQSTCRVR